MKDEEVIFSILFFLFIIIYLIGFANFFVKNALWILFLFVAIAFFIWKDAVIQEENIKKNLIVKDRREIRINFWN